MTYSHEYKEPGTGSFQINMEAFTYENIYYDECTERHSLFVLPPVSKRTKTREYVFRFMSASSIIVCLVYIYFIKEISPFQMATTDVQYGFDEGILDMSIRCSKSSRKNDLPGSSYVNNITDWSFKTYIGCPVIQSLTLKYTRRKHELKCDDCKGTIRYVTTAYGGIFLPSDRIILWPLIPLAKYEYIHVHGEYDCRVPETVVYKLQHNYRHNWDSTLRISILILQAK